MKQIIFRLLAMILAFIFGVTWFWVITIFNQQQATLQVDGWNSKSPYDEVWTYYDDSWTTDDFEQFGAEFKSAVRSDDKEKLFSLTLHKQFSWEERGLRLSSKPNDNYYYFIKSYDEFLRDYQKIFSAQIKREILNGKFIESTKQFYSLEWQTQEASYTLMFQYIEGKGYKFTGLLMGPL